MKTIQWMLALMLLGVAGPGSAWADRGHEHEHGHGHGHGHVQLGIEIGPFWGPWHHRPFGYPYPYYYGYPYPYYDYPYYPPVVVAPAAPPVYIEQGSGPAPQTNYWYYCNASRAYYPYVKECPGGWQQVVPQPPQP